LEEPILQELSHNQSIKERQVSLLGKSAINPAVIAAHSAELDNKKNIQVAVSDPTANGSSLTFIDTISQDTQGVITATKKSVTVDASPTQNSANPVQSGGVYSANAAQNTQIANLKSDLGVVEDTNTATHTISKGQYVIWKGELYTAKSAIPSGTALSSSNLQAVSNGGLNAVNDRIGIKDVTYTVASTSVGAKSQSYAYVAVQSGYTPISAYFVPGSGSSIIIILSNPVVSSSQVVCRIFNPNDQAATVAGTLHVLFAKNAMIES
jgi:hypothetical protein